jgi:hypothetical protein
MRRAQRAKHVCNKVRSRVRFGLILGFFQIQTCAKCRTSAAEHDESVRLADRKRV